jgi:hypothetical protein
MASKDLAGLKPGTSYVVQVRAVGANATDISDWSTAYVFVTPGNPSGTTNTTQSTQLGKGATIFAGNPPQSLLLAGSTSAPGNSGLVVSDNTFQALDKDGKAIFRIDVPNQSVLINANNSSGTSVFKLDTSSQSLTMTGGVINATGGSISTGAGSFSGSLSSSVQTTLGGTTNMTGITYINGTNYIYGNTIISNGNVLINSSSVNVYATATTPGTASGSYGAWSLINPGANPFPGSSAGYGGNGAVAVANGSTAWFIFGTTSGSSITSSTWNAAIPYFINSNLVVSGTFNSGGASMDGSYTVNGYGTQSATDSSGATITVYYLTASTSKVGYSIPDQGTASGTLTGNSGSSSGGYLSLTSSGITFPTFSTLTEVSNGIKTSNSSALTSLVMRNIAIDSTSPSSTTPTGGANGDLYFYVN